MQAAARNARLEAVPNIGQDGVALLARSHVVVFGTGNIGGLVAQQLVNCVGCITCVDRGRVELENLGPQGFRFADCGVPKAVARARALQPLNPDCRIQPIHADLRRLGLAMFQDADLWISALDSRIARAALSEDATALGRPWLDCAMEGSGRMLLGRVALYVPGGACYVCPRDAAALAEIAAEGRAGCPVWRWGQAEETTAPTLASPGMGAVVAGIAAVWAVRALLGLSADLAGRELLLDLDHGTLSFRRLPRNPACLADHGRLALTPVECVSVGDTFARAEAMVGAPAVLALRRHSVVCAMRCPRCNQERRPYRLLDAIPEEQGRCACGALMQPVAGGVLDSFNRGQAEAFSDCSWRQLGLPADDVVAARGPRGEIFLWMRSSSAF